MKFMAFARYISTPLLAPAVLFDAGSVLAREQERGVIPVEARSARLTLREITDRLATVSNRAWITEIHRLERRKS
jgi:hypothetical protein